MRLVMARSFLSGWPGARMAQTSQGLRHGMGHVSRNTGSRGSHHKALDELSTTLEQAGGEIFIIWAFHVLGTKKAGTPEKSRVPVSVL